jgi:hypothetical protein
MPTVELDEAEWSQVISIIAMSHPLVARISSQIVAQKMGERDAGEQTHATGDERQAQPDVAARPGQRGGPRPANGAGDRDGERRS